MIFSLYLQYQQRLVLQVGASRQWITKHINVSITTGLQPRLTVQKACTSQEDYQIDFFQESSVTFMRNGSFFKWRFIKQFGTVNYHHRDGE